MMSLYEMKKDLNYYYNLKDLLNSIVDCYNKNILNLEPSIKSLKDSYNVDGVSKGSLSLSKGLESLIEKRDYIKKTIIPTINFEISKLKQKIEEEQLKLT